MHNTKILLIIAISFTQLEIYSILHSTVCHHFKLDIMYIYNV